MLLDRDQNACGLQHEEEERLMVVLINVLYNLCKGNI